MRRSVVRGFAALLASLGILAPDIATAQSTATLLGASIVSGRDGAPALLLEFDRAASCMTSPPKALRVLVACAATVSKPIPPVASIGNEMQAAVRGRVAVTPIEIAITITSDLAISGTESRGTTYVVYTSRTRAEVVAPRAVAPQEAGESRIYDVVHRRMLRYADVSEIVGILTKTTTVAPNDRFIPQSTPLGQSASGGPLTPTGFQTSSQGDSYQQNTASRAERITDNIAIDRRLNAIFLSGDDATVRKLNAAIDEIDIPLPAVTLETQIVELTETAAKAVGIDFSPNGQLASVSSTIRTQQTQDTTVSLAAQILAQVDQGRGRILARPRVLALSGETASILTGDAIPIITSIVFPGSNSVQQQVQYVNVGVTLQILPRVTDDGHVHAQLLSEVSSVTSFTQNIPQISQRRASTAAIVRDGESFAVGGLLQETEIQSIRKVPILGDLPLLSPLFRAVRSSMTKTNLYIIVTPHISQIR